MATFRMKPAAANSFAFNAEHAHIDFIAAQRRYGDFLGESICRLIDIACKTGPELGAEEHPSSAGRPKRLASGLDLGSLLSTGEEWRVIRLFLQIGGPFCRCPHDKSPICIGAPALWKVPY